MSFAGLSFAFSGSIAIFTSVLMARIFGIDTVGENALAMVPNGILWLVSSVREQPAVIRRLAPMQPRAPGVSGTFYAVFAFSMTLTMTMTLLVGLGTVLIFEQSLDRPDLIAPALVYLAANLIFTNSSSNMDMVFAAFGDGRSLYRVRLAESVCYAIGLVVAAEITRSVWGPVLAAVTSGAVACMYRFRFIGTWLDPRTSRAGLRAGASDLPEFIRFGLKLTPGTLADGASAQAAFWALGSVSTTAAVGAYSRASALSYRLNEATWRISEMLLPSLVQSEEAKDSQQRDRRYALGLRGSFGLLIGAATIVGGASQGVMAMFGPEFVSAAPALIILSLVPAMSAIATTQGDVLVAANRPGGVSGLAVASFLITAALTWPMTSEWGATGAAAAFLSGATARTVFAALALHRWVGVRSRLHWPVRQRAGMGVAYVAGVAAGWGVSELIPTALDLAVGVAVSFTVFGVALLVTGAVTSAEVRQAWGMVRRRLPGRK